jgi:hypothetical protein
MDGKVNKYNSYFNEDMNRIYGIHIFKNLNIFFFFLFQILSASRYSHNLYAFISFRLLYLAYLGIKCYAFCIENGEKDIFHVTMLVYPQNVQSNPSSTVRPLAQERNSPSWNINFVIINKKTNKASRALNSSNRARKKASV